MSPIFARYSFDEQGGETIFDDSPNQYHGSLGDATIGNLDAARDTRPAPTRGPNAPITETSTVELQTVDGSLVDTDGEVVQFDAISLDPNVTVSVTGQTLSVTYNAGDPRTARIVAIAADEGGRQSRTGFDWNVDSTQDVLPNVNTSTVLTFDGGFPLASIIDPDYGDRVTATTEGNFSYGGGSQGPFTPNVVVDYPNGTRFWNNNFGDLVNSIHRALGADTLDIVLVADPGFEVALHGFDLGGWDRTDRPIDSIEVIGGSGDVLFSQTGITVLGAGPAHSDFDFTQPLTGQSLRIRLDPGVSQSAVGIDNIQFSQVEVLTRQFVYGTVFVDSNTDGQHSASEPTVDGVAIHLLDAFNQVIACTVTDVSGNYRFAETGTAANAVELVIPDGWEATGPTRIPLTGIPADLSIDFPVAKPLDIGPDRRDDEGITQTFSISGSSFEPGTPINEEVRYQWSVTVSDGSEVAGGFGDTFEFTPEDEADFRVSVVKQRRVVQADDSIVWVPEASDEMRLRVEDAPPQSRIEVVSASPPIGSPQASMQASETVSVPEGIPVEFRASVLDAGTFDSVTDFRWEAFDASGSAIDSFSGIGDVMPWTRTFAAEGHYSVSLTVTSSALVGTSSLAVEVVNAEPTVSLAEPPSALAAGSLEVSGSFDDPSDDFWLGTADFGDGTQKPLVLRNDRSFDFTHQYQSPGRYEVTVTIDDRDGGSGTRSFEVLFDPLPPSGITAAVASIDESGEPVVGSQWVTTIGVIDPSIEDSHTVALVDGSGDLDNERFLVVADQLFLKDGEVIDYETRPEYRIRVAATDLAGNVLESELTIQVNNLPEVDSVIINDGAAQRSQIRRIEVTFDQVVDVDPQALQIRRGDGTLVSSSVSLRIEDGRTIGAIAFDDANPLADGDYQLVVRGDRVVAGGRVMPEDTVDDFFQKFGDHDGNDQINLFDFAAFRSTYGKSEGDEGFFEHFDGNGDGVINLFDFARFRGAYGQ